VILVIPGRRVSAGPGIQSHASCLHFWIPGSLVSLASRNDAGLFNASSPGFLRPRAGRLLSPTRLRPSGLGGFAVRRALNQNEAVRAIFLPPTAPRRSETTQQIIRRLFALSPAQANLTALLMTGRSVKDIAVILDITEGSARQYLKRIFKKTGAKRQADLVLKLNNRLCPLRPNSDRSRHGSELSRSATSRHSADRGSENGANFIEKASRLYEQERRAVSAPPALEICTSGDDSGRQRVANGSVGNHDARTIRQI